MASSLGMEIYFLLEHLISIDSPLVLNIRKYYKSEYFSDLVSQWKRIDYYTQELSEIKRGIHNLSALIIQTPLLSQPTFQMEYIEPQAENFFSNLEPISTSKEEDQGVKKTIKKVTQHRKKNEKNFSTPTA